MESSREYVSSESCNWEVATILYSGQFATFDCTPDVSGNNVASYIETDL
jgi:hypothetical protein